MRPLYVLLTLAALVAPVAAQTPDETPFDQPTPVVFTKIEDPGNLRFGAPATFEAEVKVTYVASASLLNEKLVVRLRIDEMPDWADVTLSTDTLEIPVEKVSTSQQITSVATFQVTATLLQNLPLAESAVLRLAAVLEQATLSRSSSTVGEIFLHVEGEARREAPATAEVTLQRGGGGPAPQDETPRKVPAVPILLLGGGAALAALGLRRGRP
ncbi:MAG TPA: hypothetical protein VNZ52_16110 [Candidatus Thermoplasmatota archaeon]|nr:hypothetical protein [Candidatus Thermoplasmatota archaeon]